MTFSVGRAVAFAGPTARTASRMVGSAKRASSIKTSPPITPGVSRLGYGLCMDLTFDERELAFRDELRAWLDANSPGDGPDGEDDNYSWRRDWQRQLHEGGWAGV